MDHTATGRLQNKHSKGTKTFWKTKDWIIINNNLGLPKTKMPCQQNAEAK